MPIYQKSSDRFYLKVLLLGKQKTPGISGAKAVDVKCILQTPLKKKHQSYPFFRLQS